MRAILKTQSFDDASKRDPHCSRDTWIVEPFDDELELWTLGDKAGFTWVLMVADPDSKRYRALPREEGIAEIRAQWDPDPQYVLLGGQVVADMIDIEICNLTVPIDTGEQGVGVDVSAVADLLARVCARLKTLQLYDGRKRFETESPECTPIWAVLDLGLLTGKRQ